MAGGTHFVVDASVILKWLNQDREQHTEEAFDILTHAATSAFFITTSDLAVHEVLNALVRGKGLRERELGEAVENFFALPLRAIATDLHLAAASAILADEYKLTFYDAVYMALAFDLNIPLITANPKHQKSIAGIQVIPLSNWFSFQAVR